MSLVENLKFSFRVQIIFLREEEGRERIFHILFHPPRSNNNGVVNPYSPSLRQKDECTPVKYLVTETPANILGKLIRHLAPR